MRCIFVEKAVCYVNQRREFYKKVAERFDYVIDRSQVVDSVFHRTQSMRSTNSFAKASTAFMS